MKEGIGESEGGYSGNEMIFKKDWLRRASGLPDEGGARVSRFVSESKEVGR